MQILERIEKWTWKMDYCKKKGFPPAQSWAWKTAEIAYNLKKQLFEKEDEIK